MIINKYTFVNASDIGLSITHSNSLSKLYVETDAKGNVLKEVGVNTRGDIVHAFPSEMYPDGKYGFFDLVPFSENLTSDIDDCFFLELWSKVCLE